MKEKWAKLIDVKSIVTLLMSIAMVLMLIGVFKPTTEAFGLFASVYGSVITYFFTKKKDSEV
jgi:TctA family transporter